MRIAHLISMSVIIFAGLWLRSPFCPFPVFLVKYGGVALWALLVFLLISFIRPNLPLKKRVFIALCFSWVVEFSQLYHAPWIDEIRATRAGALILGSIFNWPDLAAYAAGVLSGTLGEYIVCRWTNS